MKQLALARGPAEARKREAFELGGGTRWALPSGGRVWKTLPEVQQLFHRWPEKAIYLAAPATLCHRVGMRFLILFSSLLLLTHCGDDDGVADAGSDSSTVDSGNDDAGGDDAGGDDAGGDDAGDDAGGGDAGGDAGGGDAGTDDAGPTDVEITVEDAQAWANCMPIVPEDPLRFFLELTYDNSGGSAEATAEITSATLTFDDADGSVTTIAFDVESVSIPAGESVTQSHSKTTSTPVVPSCAICSAERMMTYSVTITVDGVPVNVDGTINFGCTF